MIMQMCGFLIYHYNNWLLDDRSRRDDVEEVTLDEEMSPEINLSRAEEEEKSQWGSHSIALWHEPQLAGFQTLAASFGAFK